MIEEITYKNKLLAFTGKVGDLMRNEIKIVDENCSVHDASKLLINPLINYLVVQRGSIPVGIITKQDIISRGTDKINDRITNVSEIMNKYIISVQKDESVFDTLMFMFQHELKHVIVLDKEIPISVLTQDDWVTIQINYPVFLIGNIERSQSIDQLVDLRKESKKIIWDNFEKEKNAASLTGLITVINDAICKRIIQLSLEKMQTSGNGLPPVSFAWIGMGSEGRKAQTVRTDQDNGLIFDNVDPADYDNVKDWFLNFAALVVTGLDQCGFPFCQGEIMANNPKLCNSLDKWTEQFNKIIQKADVKELLEASIYFDFRCVYGNESLTDKLWDNLFVFIDQHKLFMTFFADNIIQASRPPIKKWQWNVPRFMSVKIPAFDIKREGTAPLDAAIRLLALHHKIKETNTIERLNILLTVGGISKTLADDVYAAFDFILKLRFRLEFSMNTEVATQEHIVFPEDLMHLEIRKLKAALQTIYTLQEFAYEQITGKKVPWIFK